LFVFLSSLSQRQIERRIYRSFQTVNLWIQRFQNEGIQGLTTRARSGRPRVTPVDEYMAIITASKLKLLSIGSFNRAKYGYFFTKRYDIRACRKSCHFGWSR
jgi:transposase